MAAYVISELTHIDPAHIRAYIDLARPSIAAHGGRYLTSTTDIELLEGDAAPLRFVIVEFPSMEQARLWYASTDYAEALKVKPQALRRRLMLVNGKVD